MEPIKLSDKQKEYIQNANRRWGLKTGATRSGKSFCDIAYIIPKRILDLKDEAGLVFILGVSQATIERNILEPMRAIYGKRVGKITPSKNTIKMFGQDVYVLGAEKINQVAKIQGASVKYCYIDEVAKIHPEVFNMLKSRLDKPYSCCDMTCNPENPGNFVKKFMDSDVDIYVQRYRIFDNPHLDKQVIEELCKEYAGTIYYDRYIEGLWVRAEGAIYRRFADSPESFKTTISRGEMDQITVGVDFGGNGSGHAFVASGIEGDYENLIALASERIVPADYGGDIDANVLNREIDRFVDKVESKYGPVDYLYYDNAETVLGTGLKNYMAKMHPDMIVRGAKKMRINDRINATTRLIGAERFYYTEDCETLETALSEAVWDAKAKQDTRLDDGTVDVDTLDAFEYSFEREIGRLLTE